ncbi:hypothetical protein [Pseudomonas sp. OHS18]|uniref:hypothetical protein n=1 Tax=Pseudomonas sp. OHS18 TaxID=3399679 RepID=UPI003A89C4D5
MNLRALLFVFVLLLGLAPWRCRPSRSPCSTTSACTPWWCSVWCCSPALAA